MGKKKSEVIPVRGERMEIRVLSDGTLMEVNKIKVEASYRALQKALENNPRVVVEIINEHIKDIYEIIKSLEEKELKNAKDEEEKEWYINVIEGYKQDIEELRKVRNEILKDIITTEKILVASKRAIALCDLVDIDIRGCEEYGYAIYVEGYRELDVEYPSVTCEIIDGIKQWERVELIRKKIKELICLRIWEGKVVDLEEIKHNIEKMMEKMENEGAE